MHSAERVRACPQPPLQGGRVRAPVPDLQASKPTFFPVHLFMSQNIQQLMSSPKTVHPKRAMSITQSYLRISQEAMKILCSRLNNDPPNISGPNPRNLYTLPYVERVLTDGIKLRILRWGD